MHCAMSSGPLGLSNSLCEVQPLSLQGHACSRRATILYSLHVWPLEDILRPIAPTLKRLAAPLSSRRNIHVACPILDSGQMSIALAARAIMNYFMAEHIAVDAKVLLASRTLIPGRF